MIAIRPEAPSDAEAIGEVTRLAFTGIRYSCGREHLLVAALREAGALAISLVAEEDGTIVGHISFSPVDIGNGISGWLGLAPLSVHPPRQRQGIGTRLVEAGLRVARDLGKRGCVLIGEASFYGRFGFTSPGGLSLGDVPPEFVLALPFGGPMPAGRIDYHPAFALCG